jgi:pilus assembly protein CpaD
MTTTSKSAIASGLLRGAAFAALSMMLAGCYQTAPVAQQDAYYPYDYRERHPITVREGDRTVDIFIGSKRGGLTPAQRADVLAFANLWRRDSTSGIIVELPQGHAARAASDAMREMHAIFAAAGVPPQAVSTRSYRPAGSLASIKLSYSKLTAQAGPCGQWPSDIGVSIESDHNLNRPYWNFGCASQRNLASMVANPADLVQPREETSGYTPRRTVVLDKYRIGDGTSGKYDGYTKGNVSDLAKQ